MNLQPQGGDRTSISSIDQSSIHVDDDLASSNSNNILNQNLSGSFLVRQPSITSTDERRGSYEEDFSNSQSTIYQPPIGVDATQSDTPTSHWPASRHNTQYQPLSNSRIGVVAIPNQNFQPIPATSDMADNHRLHRENTQRPSPGSSDKYFV